MKIGHGQQSVVPHASLATQQPAHRAGSSPPGLPREENNARARPFESPSVQENPRHNIIKIV